MSVKLAMDSRVESMMIEPASSASEFSCWARIYPAEADGVPASRMPTASSFPTTPKAIRITAANIGNKTILITVEKTAITISPFSFSGENEAPITIKASGNDIPVRISKDLAKTSGNGSAKKLQIIPKKDDRMIGFKPI